MALSGKLALITGAASGIGLSTAKLFAQNNADLALTDVSDKIVQVAKEIQEEARQSGHNINVSGHVCDVSKSDQVNRLFDELLQAHSTKHKAANVVVNCAGISQYSTFFDITEEDLDRMISVNLKGTFLITQAACRLLKNTFSSDDFAGSTRSHASIINMSSIAAKNGYSVFCHYSASKGGISGLTKALAQELAPLKIRVNAILPNVIQTPMIAPIMLDKEFEAFTRNSIPLGRYGQPEEVADLILYLASDSASFVSGSLIDLSGGS